MAHEIILELNPNLWTTHGKPAVEQQGGMSLAAILGEMTSGLTRDPSKFPLFESRYPVPYFNAWFFFTDTSTCEKHILRLLE